MTLASLVNSERNAEAKRFLESLRAQLMNSEQVVPSTPAAPPAAATRSSFDEDLQRVCEWHELHGDDRDETIVAYLQSLNTDGLENLQANLERMRTNCATNIASHRENEARIAAGRFIEDQSHYRMLVLAGGPRDPAWLRDLEALEGWARWFDAVHDVVGRSIHDRRRPPAVAKAPPASQARSASLVELDELRTFLEQQIASGEVRSDRATPLRRQLDKIEALHIALERGEIDNAQAASRVKQLYADMAPFFADPGPEARAGSGSARRREVNEYAGAIKVALGRELMEAPPEATAAALGAVLGDLKRIQDEVAEATDDDALAQLESKLLRPAARARHELAMTRHALIARPLWESVEYLPTVNTIAYSGGADLQARLEAALAPRRLMVSKRQQTSSQVRWDELNTCHVAFFDLRGASGVTRLITKEPERARELAAAAYELGLAFALGKPVIVAGSAGETMPFDLDIAPLELDGRQDEAALMVQAVDQAFYVPQRSGRNSSIRESIGFLGHLTRGHAQRASFEGMGWLDPARAQDAAGFAANTEQLMRLLPGPPWRLLRPAWPATYADPTDRRCFHVMPFGPDWANEVRDAARAACDERGILYRRGDEAEEGRIIHAIWDDLCRASIVLVDLTGANLNVMIELGIAHAIGRPVLAVRQPGPVDLRPKHIEKLRVLPYESASGLRELLLHKLRP